MSIDTISNFLTIIRNGLRASKAMVVAPYSQLKAEIARILKEEGFIRDFEVLDNPDKVGKELKIYLKYYDGESVIHEIKRVSRPGLRRYKAAKMIEPVIGGLGLSIVSTNQGVMSHLKAKKLGIGGEVICAVW